MQIQNTRTVAALVLCALSPLAHGGQKLAFEGIHYYSAQFQTVQLEPGHTYSMLKEWRGIHAATDTANATHLTRLECTGFIDSKPDNTFNAEGYCNHWDREGHHWVGRWWNRTGMDVGRFEIIAGDGKYKGVTGGGITSCEFPKGPPDPQAICTIKAVLELK